MDATSGGLAAWAEVADELEWATPWTSLYEPEGRFGHWFPGGRINLAVNCVDRHVRAGRGEAPAILWEGEPGDRRVLTYGRLREEVGFLAGALRDLGVGAGDRVALHLGSLPEAATAVLACARIGAVHTTLAANQSVPALADLLTVLRPRVIFTQDGAWHGGTVIPMKARLDDAIAASGHVPHTVVIQRTGTAIGWHDRDQWFHDLLAAPRSNDQQSGPLPAALDAAHVAGVSTHLDQRGRTRSVPHGTAGLLATAVAVHRHGLSAGGGVLWCTMDLSRIETLVHGICGPLACGDATVMYEGMLDIPTKNRAWEMIKRYGVVTLVTEPSAILRLRGPQRGRGRPPAPPLRRAVIVGTPDDDDVLWLAHAASDDRISVDVAWATGETAGITWLRDPVDPTKMPDSGLVIVDGEGHEIPDGHPGELVMTRPWAGLAPEAEGPSAADAHAARGPTDDRVYRTGHRARRLPDGRMEFLGPAHTSTTEVTAPTRDA